MALYEEVPLFYLFSEIQSSNDPEASVSIKKHSWMLLDISLNSRVYIKKQKWMISFYFLTGKYYLLSLFCGIRTETHFPLKSPFIDFSQVVIQFSSGVIFVFNYGKK